VKAEVQCRHNYAETRTVCQFRPQFTTSTSSLVVTGDVNSTSTTKP